MRSDRTFLRRTAETTGLSCRWLGELRRRFEAGEEETPSGRPSIAAEERARVRALVARERASQGAATGSRPIYERLSKAEPEISLMLVREELAALKRGGRSQGQREMDAAREGYEVLGRDTMWGEDTTHLGRVEGGEEVTGELIRDRATLSTVSLTVGPPPTANDVLADLSRAALDRGGWPLVLQRDNASIYAAEIVAMELVARRVIVLRSRVHTPTDNPATEHAHGEYKAETGLGKGVVLASDEEAAARLERAQRSLDEGRIRPSRGWLTAEQLDRVVPRGDTYVDREEFYSAACSAVEAAVLGLEDADQRREAERGAIFATLCRFGLARRHVGLRKREGPIPIPETRAHSGAASTQG